MALIGTSSASAAALEILRPLALIFTVRGALNGLSSVALATNNASRIGIVVVAAAGNEGDTKYITGSPGSADTAVSVAASTSGYITGPTIEVVGTSIVTNTNIIYEPSSFSSGGHFTQKLSAELIYVGELAGVSDDTLCKMDELEANALNGKLALIRRGNCGFSDNALFSFSPVSFSRFDNSVSNGSIRMMMKLKMKIKLPDCICFSVLLCVIFLVFSVISKT